MKYRKSCGFRRLIAVGAATLAAVSLYGAVGVTYGRYYSTQFRDASFQVQKPPDITLRYDGDPTWLEGGQGTHTLSFAVGNTDAASGVPEKRDMLFRVRIYVPEQVTDSIDEVGEVGRTDSIDGTENDPTDVGDIADNTDYTGRLSFRLTIEKDGKTRELVSQVDYLSSRTPLYYIKAQSDGQSGAGWIYSFQDTGGELVLRLSGGRAEEYKFTLTLLSTDDEQITVSPESFGLYVDRVYIR